MTLQAWDPWGELRRFREDVNRLFGDLSAGGFDNVDFPPLNVAKEAEKLTIEAPLPGVDRASLDVSATGNTVTIRGERKAEPDVPADRWHSRERSAGRFARTVKVDARLSTEDIKAVYRDGILRIELPYAEEAKPRRVQIA